MVFTEIGNGRSRRRPTTLTVRSTATDDSAHEGDIIGARALSGADRRASRDQAREVWGTPPLASLQRPVMSPQRRVALLVLRTYLLIAAGFVIVKPVELGLSG